jgi:DNA polymerase-3 subunit delta'
MAKLLDKLKGHEGLLRPLLIAAEENRLAGTLIFAGPSGIGKHLAALALAQCLVCERSFKEACGDCGPCLRIEKESSESLLEVKPDGAQIKIEQARDAIRFLNLRNLGRNRIIIIDQAQLLSTQAANALLKSLEEPPHGTYFILLAPMSTSLLPTIRSRSQLIRFRPLGNNDLSQVLAASALKADAWILRSAEGSVESAKRLLESREEFVELESQVVHFLANGQSVFPASEIAKLKDAMKDKASQAYVVSVLQGLLRDGLRDRAGVGSLGRERWPELFEMLAKMSQPKIQELANRSLEIESDLGRNIDRALVLENFALRLAHP